MARQYILILLVAQFLGEKMESVTFKITENDVNKVRKEIAVEFLSLVGRGRPKDGLRFFALTVRPPIHTPPVAWRH
jgi:hypothetical protein